MKFVLRFDTKSEAYLVERWLKIGNTKGKRKVIESTMWLEEGRFASTQTLRAAKRWRDETVSKNTAGIPKREEENAV